MFTRLKSIFFLAALALAAGSALAQTQTFTRTITTQNVAATGDCTALSCAVIDMASKGGATVQVTGTYTASGGLSLQRSNNATNWETVSANAFIPVGGTGTATITSASTGTWQLGACVGFKLCRVTALGAVTGTATVEVFTTVASVGGSTSVSGGAGDASAANQVTGNNSLASIDGKLPALASGRVPVTDASVVAQGSTTSGQSVTLGGAAVTTSAPTYTTGQTAPLSIDTTGALRITGSISAGGVAQGSTTSGQTGNLTQAAVTTAAPSYTTAQTSPLSLTTAGGLRTAPSMVSGSVASGAFASGALASGSVASGAMVDLGVQADAACGTDNGTCSQIALTKRNNQNLTTLNTSVNAAPNYEAQKDTAVPTRLLAMGARIGANEDAVAMGAVTAAINVSTATTTQLVAPGSGLKVYVTGMAVIAGGIGNITFVYGTGTNCGTGTTSLSGAIPLVANAGLTLGSGLGAVLITPAGQALCVTTSAAVQMSGFVTYAQF